jgi:hypothetical protein
MKAENGMGEARGFVDADILGTPPPDGGTVRAGVNADHIVSDAPAHTATRCTAGRRGRHLPMIKGGLH